jgi:hypothetical protein
VTTPNHKLVPDVRWVLGAGAGDVLARSDPATPTDGRGAAVVVTDRAALLRQALVEDGDDPADAIPPPGTAFAAATAHYGLHVGC